MSSLNKSIHCELTNRNFFWFCNWPFSLFLRLKLFLSGIDIKCHYAIQFGFKLFLKDFSSFLSICHEFYKSIGIRLLGCCGLGRHRQSRSHTLHYVLNVTIWCISLLILLWNISLLFLLLCWSISLLILLFFINKIAEWFTLSFKQKGWSLFRSYTVYCIAYVNSKGIARFMHVH